MKQFFSLRLAAAVLVVSAALPASAQLKKAPSPVGRWEFKTAELYDSCTISGEMEIVAKSSGGAKEFSCRFRAVQDCHRGVVRTIHTDQTCSAAQAGSEVSILSKVDKIVNVKPDDLRAGMEDRYAADNFIVIINPAGDQMDGRFHSLGEAAVKFRRKQELVS